MRRILTVIPVRAGSTGIPDKNVRPLAGKPLLAHAIAAAREASLVERVVVSTDSPRYMEIANDWGAETPFQRPAELGAGTVTLVDVVKHALDWFDAAGDCYDAVLSVQATVPLLRPDTIDKVINLFHETGCAAVGTVSEIRHGHPYIAKTLDRDSGVARDFLALPPGTPRYPRQKRPELHYFNGAAFLRDRSLLDPIDYATNGLGEAPAAVPMVPEESVNIDEPFDFEMAELLMRRRNGEAR